jgi:hypothetical protein
MARRGGHHAGPGVPAEADRLYALPPERFVAERDALARDLARRRSPAVDAVKRLPRPTRLASALDRVAQARPRDIERLLAAADRLRTGQRRAMSGGGAGALREAESAFREAARALRGAAAQLLGVAATAPFLGELELALRAAAAGAEDDRERLRRGVFARPPARATGFGSLSGLTVVAGGPAPGAGRSVPSRAAAGEARADRGSPGADRARRRAEARERREEAERRRGREREAARARRDLARAEKEEARRAREVAEAEARLAAARARLDAARSALREARGRPAAFPLSPTLSPGSRRGRGRAR